MNVIVLRSDNRHVSANHVANNKNTNIRVRADKFWLHLNRKWKGKDILMN